MTAWTPQPVYSASGLDEHIAFANALFEIHSPTRVIMYAYGLMECINIERVDGEWFVRDWNGQLDDDEYDVLVAYITEHGLPGDE